MRRVLFLLLVNLICTSLFSQTDRLLKLNGTENYILKKVQYKAPTFYSSSDTCLVYYLFEVPREKETLLLFTKRVKVEINKRKLKSDLKLSELGTNNIQNLVIFSSGYEYVVDDYAYSLLPRSIPFTNNNSVYFREFHHSFLDKKEGDVLFYRQEPSGKKKIGGKIHSRNNRNYEIILSTSNVDDAVQPSYIFHEKKGLQEIISDASPHEFYVKSLKIILDSRVQP